MIKIKGERIEVLQDSFHLPASSPLYAPYRHAMRLKALELMERRSRKHQYSFSVIYSASEESRQKIQSRFLEFIDWAHKFTQSSEATEVYQINFDLLQWSGR